MNVVKESFVYCKRYMPAWISVVLIGFLSVGITALLPQVPQLLIDRIINPALGQAPVYNASNPFSWLLNGYATDDYWGMFAVVAILFGVLLLLRYGLHYLRWNVSHYYGGKAEKRMRMAVFAKLLGQNQIVLNRYTSGDLMSICNSDPVAVKEVYSQTLSLIFDQLLVVALSTVFLFRLHWLLMILPLSLGLAASLLMVFYTRALRVRYNEIRTASVALNSTVQENINGVRIVRAFAAEDIENKKFRSLNDAYREAYLRQAKTVARYNMIFNALGQAVNLGSIIVGVIMAAQGRLSLGQFTTFISYVSMINGPLVAMSNLMGGVQNSVICGNRMFTFLNTNNEICDPAEPMEIQDNPHLSLRGVTVQLDDVEELIDVDVDIPYGKKLGVMGRTGAGKSVLLKTLPRFYETTKGETCINGVNLKRYRVEDVRRLFSFVMQDVFLFSNTVDSNIAFYRPDASAEEVEKAARVAQADDFIRALDEGYNTVVGERGLGLSGGQKQRVSIARALLKDAPVLMFDDCTSALDMETERKILNGIRTHYAEKTVIISSHRASSVQDCDEILFLDGGRVAERGTHDELMAQKGLYYDIYTKQAASMAEAVA